MEETYRECTIKTDSERVYALAHPKPGAGFAPPENVPLGSWSLDTYDKATAIEHAKTAIDNYCE